MIQGKFITRLFYEHCSGNWLISKIPDHKIWKSAVEN